MDLLQNEAIWRRNAAAAETLLLRELSKHQYHGYKFRRQVCSEPFMAEFACFELKLLIELYSALHEVSGKRINKRSQTLQSKGFVLARFCHSEVLTDLLGVMNSVAVVCRQRKKQMAMSQLARRYLSGGLAKPMLSNQPLSGNR
jgi:very-short-patch-repair endonuclease